MEGTCFHKTGMEALIDCHLTLNVFVPCFLHVSVKLKHSLDRADSGLDSGGLFLLLATPFPGQLLYFEN